MDFLSLMEQEGVQALYADFKRVFEEEDRGLSLMEFISACLRAIGSHTLGAMTVTTGSNSGGGAKSATGSKAGDGPPSPSSTAAGSAAVTPRDPAAAAEEPAAAAPAEQAAITATGAVELRTLVKALADLFRHIDVNGDASMEWSEFTAFCVQQGMAATALQVPRPAFTFAFDARYADVHHHSQTFQHMLYHAEIDCVVAIEGFSKLVRFYDGRLHLLRTLDTSTAIRKSQRDVDTSVALSHAIVPALKIVAVLLSNHTVGLWSVGMRRFTYFGTLPRPEEKVTPVIMHFDPGSQMLVLGCADGSLLVYSPEQRRYVVSMLGHSDVVLSMTSCAARSILITCGLDGQVLLWDMERCKHTRVLRGHDCTVVKVIYVPRLDVVYGLTVRGEVVGWDLSLGEVVVRMAGVVAAVTKQGHNSSSGGGGGGNDSAGANAGGVISTVHHAKVFDITLVHTSPPRLLTLDITGHGKLWEIADASAGSVPCVSSFTIDLFRALNPTQALMTAPQRLRSKATEQWMAEQSDNKVELTDADSPDSATPAGVVGDLIIAAPRLYRCVTIPLDNIDVPVTALYNSALLDIITTTARDIHIWDADTGKRSLIFPECVNSDIASACLDDRHRKLFVGRQDGLVVSLNLLNGSTMKFGCILGPQAATTLAYKDSAAEEKADSDGEQGPSEGQDAGAEDPANTEGDKTGKKGKAKMEPQSNEGPVMLDSEEKLQQLKAEAALLGQVTVVKYHKASRCLVTAGTDGSLAVYDDEPEGFLDDLRVVRRAHPVDITALAVSEELSMVVTGDRNGCVRVWDFQDLKLMADLTEHDSTVTAIACAGALPAFITADAEGKIVVWTGRGHHAPFQKLYTFKNVHRVVEVYDPEDERLRELERQSHIRTDGLQDEFSLGDLDDPRVKHHPGHLSATLVQAKLERHFRGLRSADSNGTVPVNSGYGRQKWFKKLVAMLAPYNEEQLAATLSGRDQLSALVDQILDEKAIKQEAAATGQDEKTLLKQRQSRAKLSLVSHKELDANFEEEEGDLSARSNDSGNGDERISRHRLHRMGITDPEVAARLRTRNRQIDVPVTGMHLIIPNFQDSGVSADSADEKSVAPSADGSSIVMTARSEHAHKLEEMEEANAASVASFLHSIVYLLTSDDAGKVKVLDLTKVIRRTGIEPLPLSKRPLEHPGYSSSRRTHRDEPGPVITDDQWFYTDEDPSERNGDELTLVDAELALDLDDTIQQKYKEMEDEYRESIQSGAGGGGTFVVGPAPGAKRRAKSQTASLGSSMKKKIAEATMQPVPGTGGRNGFKTGAVQGSSISGAITVSPSKSSPNRGRSLTKKDGGSPNKTAINASAKSPRRQAGEEDDAEEEEQMPQKKVVRPPPRPARSVPPIGMSLTLGGDLGLGIASVARRRPKEVNRIMRKAALMAGLHHSVAGGAYEFVLNRRNPAHRSLMLAEEERESRMEQQHDGPPKPAKDHRMTLIMRDMALEANQRGSSADERRGSVSSVASANLAALSQAPGTADAMMGRRLKMIKIKELEHEPDDIRQIRSWTAHLCPIAVFNPFLLERVRRGDAPRVVPAENSGSSVEADLYAGPNGMDRPDLFGYYASTIGSDSRIYMWDLFSGQRVGQVGLVAADEDAIISGHLKSVAWEFPQQREMLEVEKTREVAEILEELGDLDFSGPPKEDDKSSATASDPIMDANAHQQHMLTQELVNLRVAAGKIAPDALSQATNAIRMMNLGPNAITVLMESGRLERPATDEDNGIFLTEVADPSSPGKPSPTTGETAAPLSASVAAADSSPKATKKEKMVTLIDLKGSLEQNRNAAPLTHDGKPVLPVRDGEDIEGLPKVARELRLVEAMPRGEGRKALRKLTTSHTTDTIMDILTEQNPAMAASDDAEELMQLLSADVGASETGMVPAEELVVGTDAEIMKSLEMYDETDKIEQVKQQSAWSRLSEVKSDLKKPFKIQTSGGEKKSATAQAVLEQTVTSVLYSNAPASVAATRLGPAAMAVLSMSGYEATGLASAIAMKKVRPILEPYRHAIDANLRLADQVVMTSRGTTFDHKAKKTAGDPVKPPEAVPLSITTALKLVRLTGGLVPPMSTSVGKVEKQYINLSRESQLKAAEEARRKTGSLTPFILMSQNDAPKLPTDAKIAEKVSLAETTRSIADASVAAVAAATAEPQSVSAASAVVAPDQVAAAGSISSLRSTGNALSVHPPLTTMKSTSSSVGFSASASAASPQRASATALGATVKPASPAAILPRSRSGVLGQTGKSSLMAPGSPSMNTPRSALFIAPKNALLDPVEADKSNSAIQALSASGLKRLDKINAVLMAASKPMAPSGTGAPRAGRRGSMSEHAAYDLLFKPGDDRDISPGGQLARIRYNVHKHTKVDREKEFLGRTFVRPTHQKEELDFGDQMPSLIGPYSSLEVIKVREIYDKCEANNSGQSGDVPLDKLQGMSDWLGLYSMERLRDLFERLLHDKGELVTLHDLFHTAFPLADGYQLKAMAHWSDKRTRRRLRQKKAKIPWQQVLSPAQQAELSTIFDAVDADGSGAVGFEELRFVVGQSSGAGESVFSAKDIEQIFEEYDVDGSGQIEKTEFFQLWADIMGDNS